MPVLTLSDISAGTGGIILSGRDDQTFSTFSIDSRTVAPGAFFFAIKGRHYDGHDFLYDAIAKGARGLAAHRDMDELRIFPNVVMVKDTLKSLQELARWVRARSSTTVIGVTGTTGKTSTKDFIATLLGKNALKSEGNLNNQYGLPLSILKLKQGQTHAVLEMGMSTPGEIKRLCQIAQPNVGVVTNISPVHMQTMKTIDNVARAKAELIEALPKDGLAILNGDDPRVMKISKRFRGRKLTYGFGAGNRYRATRLRCLGTRGMKFTLTIGSRRATVTAHVLGRHSVSNLLAAVAVADAMGVPMKTIVRRLHSVRPAQLRGEVVKLPNGALLLNEAYNSNPRALEAAVETLVSFPCKGRRVLVAGDMLELGKRSRLMHLESGRQIGRQRGLHALITVGGEAAAFAEGARKMGFRGEMKSFRDASQTGEFLRNTLQPGDVVVVKGSRGVALEKIIDLLGREITQRN